MACTTCAAVITLPSAEMRTPEPVSAKRVCPEAVTSRPRARITATDGDTFSNTCRTVWAPAGTGPHASAEMNSAASESPRPGRTDTILAMGRLHDLAVFECAIAIIARAVEVVKILEPRMPSRSSASASRPACRALSPLPSVYIWSLLADILRGGDHPRPLAGCRARRRNCWLCCQPSPCRLGLAATRLSLAAW